MPHLIFILICFIWGSSFILMKKASLVFGPVGIGGLRVLGGAAFLAAVIWISGGRWGIRRRDLGPLALVVLLGYALPYTLQPYLVAQHGSGFIGMMVSLVPLMTMAVSVPMLGIRPSPRQAVGVVAGLGCIGIILADGVDRAVSPADLALALFVPLCYAVGNTLIKQRLSHASPVALAMLAMASASAILLPLTAAVPGETPRLDGPVWLAAGALAALGVLGTGLAISLFYKLIRDHGPLFAGMVTYLVPVGAVLWGWADAERVTLAQLLALAGVFISVAVVQYGATGRRPVEDEAPTLEDETSEASS